MSDWGEMRKVVSSSCASLRAARNWYIFGGKGGFCKGVFICGTAGLC